MTMRAIADRRGEHAAGHPDEVREVHERLVHASQVASRQIEVRSGRRVHIIEAGEGPPVLFLHGSSEASLALLTPDVAGSDRGLSLLERLEGVRAIAVDRPGYGLSEPVHFDAQRYREIAVEFVDEVLDELKLDRPTLAGSSMGGTWALWYALARPERVRRLALLTAAPLLPGTRVPAPLRVMAAPVIGNLLARLKPDAKMVVRFMSKMGEKDTIGRYPGLIEALVVAGKDPIASAAGLDEFRAAISGFGWRRSLLVRPEELRRLMLPTMLIWGDHDPVGGVEVAQAIAALVPNAQLEVLPAGHVPWLGNPERVSELLSRFVRPESAG
jgi:pimeloyl-ACP methyl ester carboxylesterase